MTRAATHAIHFAACETEDRQMQYAILYRLVVVATSTILMLAFGTQAEAQTLKGQARALQSSIINPLGITTTVLADTGSLGGASVAVGRQCPFHRVRQDASCDNDRLA
jgi:hypothetical protein